MKETWKLYYYKWNSGNPTWLHLDDAEITSFPREGDRITPSGSKDLVEIVWAIWDEKKAGVRNI